MYKGYTIFLELNPFKNLKLQPSGTGTISENSNVQNESDEKLEEIQIGSYNGRTDVEIHKIEDINQDKDAWWKHSAPGPSHKK